MEPAGQPLPHKDSETGRDAPKVSCGNKHNTITIMHVVVITYMPRVKPKYELITLQAFV